MTSRPLVIAWQYINNGLASWGWEAAHALAEAGEDVLLIHSEGFPLPAPTHARVRPVAYDPSWARGEGAVFRIRRRLGRDLGHVVLNRNGFVYDLHRHLKNMGVVPRAYFLNQSDIMDERVATPQYPVAWAYPTHLQGYIYKTRWYTGSAWWSTKGLGTTRFSLGWYRRDWRAYRRATGGVLAVSERIAADLQEKGVRNVSVVHPGTQVPPLLERSAEESATQLRIITVAVDLEDPRKRIRWMVEALKTIPDPRFTLTVVGKSSPALEEWAASNGFPVRFTGSISRDATQALMAQHDLFLFGSLVDDWGYVLIEAMGRGLMIAAPNLSPFDEIVGDAGVFYTHDDPKGLAQLITALSADSLKAGRHAAYARAVEKFSRPAFARSLLSAIGPRERAA